MTDNNSFDIKEELKEFIENKFVDKVEFIKQNPDYNLLKIFTLENNFFLLECSSQKGISVINFFLFNILILYF